MLTLVEGPAGAGKSQVVAEMIESGEVDVQADVTQLWAATRGMRRGEDGRFPVRTDDDPAITSGLATYVKAVVVRQGLERGLNVAVTTSSPDEAPKWATVADEAGTSFSIRTVDPGREAAEAALTIEGQLSVECDRALGRWFR